jgi:hypothetical protein
VVALMVSATAIWAADPGQAAMLHVTLSSGRADAIRAVYQNGTNQPAKINAQVIESSILTLEVHDAAGERVYTLPPPVPWAKTQYVVIQPGKDFAIDYTLNIFNPTLPPGTYRVGVKNTNSWTSNVIRVTVSKAVGQ